MLIVGTLMEITMGTIIIESITTNTTTTTTTISTTYLIQLIYQPHELLLTQYWK